MKKKNVMIQPRSERLVDVSLDLSELIDYELTNAHLSNNGNHYWIINHRERLEHPRLSNVTVVVQAYISESNYAQEKDRAERLKEAYRLRDNLKTFAGFVDIPNFNNTSFDDLDDDSLLMLLDQLNKMKNS